jgi:transposase
MVTNIDKQQKFIELRAEGKSFDEIAKKINISKPTLIKWSKELKEKIEEVSRIIEEQFIIEQKVKRTIRAQKLSEELDKAYEALKHTDYKNMSKKDLISVIEKLENKLSAIIGIDAIPGKGKFAPIDVKIVYENEEENQNNLEQIDKIIDESQKDKSKALNRNLKPPEA